MKRLNKKVTFITNLILTSVLLIVIAVSFLPEKIVPIYSENNIEAIYNGNREKPNVSIMFNVYENTEIVNGILDELKNKNVKGTFFVGGCWADDNKETLIRIVNEGHEIANHGYFHKDHKKLSEQGNVEEISHTNVIVKALCGVEPTLFAPPSGSFSVTTLKVAEQMNLKVIMWSKDTIDWRDSDENLIIKRATKDIENGDFILMHPKKHTLNALPKIIDYYQSVGFSLVTVSQSII